jgi:hypothetical protein
MLTGRALDNPTKIGIISDLKNTPFSVQNL